MSIGLRLESFTPAVAAPPPPITAAQLAQARREGFEGGRAAAEAETAAALQDVVAALARAETERRAREMALRADAAALVRAVIARIAPPLRAASLIDRVLVELDRLSARDAPLACRIRCPESLIRPLGLALDKAGRSGVEVIAGSGPLEVTLPGGALRIDMTAFEAALVRVAEDLMEEQS